MDNASRSSTRSSKIVGFGGGGIEGGRASIQIDTKTKVVGTSALLTLLTACSNAASAQPTAEMPTQAAPTLAPTVTSPLPTETVTVPTVEPTATNEPFTGVNQEWIAKHPISQELMNKGLETGVIRQPEDLSRLTFDIHENLNDKGEQIAFARDPDTNEILFATRISPETHEADWYVAGLRDMADVLGIRMGTQLYAPNSGLYSHQDIQRINELVTQEYNHAIVIETGWAFTEKKQEGVFDFTNADAAIDLALKNGMTVEGDDLIFGGSDFDYSYIGQFETKLRNQGLDDAQIKERFKQAVVNHIQQTVAHFKGRVQEWSVLNEWRGLDRDYPDIYAKIFQNDQEFIRLVFQTARDADPTARLFINDNDINTPNQYGYPRTLAIVEDLKSLGLIDAVGLQMTDANVANPPNEQQVISAMKSWGIPVIVTSATFSTEGVPGTPQEVDLKQAQVGHDMLDACIQSNVCRDFRFWDGAGDNFSFKGADARATLFDGDMKPKPIYFTFKDYLTQMVDSPAN